MDTGTTAACGHRVEERGEEEEDEINERGTFGLICGTNIGNNVNSCVAYCRCNKNMWWIFFPKTKIGTIL
jgi:hypothetical protein